MDYGRRFTDKLLKVYSVFSVSSVVRLIDHQTDSIFTTEIKEFSEARRLSPIARVWFADQ